MKILEIKLTGQIRGAGKNNYMVVNGKHIPRKEFLQWREKATWEVLEQVGKLKPITQNNLWWLFEYTPADRRIRDITAIQDALFHLLERCGVVQNDSLIKNLIFKTKEPNKETACVKIIVFELFEERSRYGKMWRVSPVAENLN